MTDIKRRGDPRALSCNDGHDLCYCAGRPECHNCGQPLWDDYVKEPLDHSDYNYNHAACCDLVLSHFTYDDWEIGDDDKLRMHDYVLVIYPDAETGNKINIVCQIVEMCGVGLPALRALETGDRTSIMGHILQIVAWCELRSRRRNNHDHNNRNNFRNRNTNSPNRASNRGRDRVSRVAR